MNLYRFNAANGLKFHRSVLLFALFALGAAPPLPSSPRLARSLAKLASGGYGVRPDPTLSKIARVHAQEVLTDFRSAQLSRVKAALGAEGLADAQIAPFSAVGPDPRALIRRAEAYARTQARPRGPTHLGAALLQRGPEWALVAIFSRRTVALPPLAHRLPKQGLLIRGIAHARSTRHAFLLGPLTQRDQGHVIEVAVEKGPKNHFSINLPAPTGPGRYVFQLVETGPRGPEVAAQWTFKYGRVAQRWPPKPRRASEETANGLLALLMRARDDADLAPLTVHPALAQAAQTHAEAMCKSQVTAHTLPGGTAPDARAKSAGYTGPIHENVARAATVGQAHQNLLLSPRHRLNVMHPTAEHVGLGVASATAADGVARSRCVVQLFGVNGSLPKPGPRAR